MVLVAGILVLLVIIATAFMSRAQVGRTASVATRDAARRADVDEQIASELAKAISEHLFVRRMAGPLLPGNNNSNRPRSGLSPFAGRYGFDLGFDPTFPVQHSPYNFAPYTVSPFTNWPDAGSFQANYNFINGLLPPGPGNVGGGGMGLTALLNQEGNPIGNPGFGDTRWLRDLEPLRFDEFVPDAGGDFQQPDAFSHWRHLSYIANANNGYRLVRDISDIYDTDGDGNGGLLLELNVPVEQWLVNVQPVQFAPGNLSPNSFTFFEEWRRWLKPGNQAEPGYYYSYINLASPTGRYGPPANFYDLSLYGPASDEFAFNTERNMISRILADADGDGFTDSFWWLVPSAPESGLRHIMAVTITDSAGRINLNTATLFDRLATIGATPADVALVGDYLWNDLAGNFDNNVERVGFLDNFRNSENAWVPQLQAGSQDSAPGWLYGSTAQYFDDPGEPRRIEMWDFNANGSLPENFLGALGVLRPDGLGLDVTTGLPGYAFDLNPSFPTTQIALTNPLDRLFYWQNSGSRLLNPRYDFTPFTMADELELRGNEGQNNSWYASRLELSLQSNVNSQPGAQFLRGNNARAETSEYLDQLTARELLFDPRHRMTTYNATRNDLMPPWLWWRWNAAPALFEDLVTANGFINDVPEQERFNYFLNQTKFKLDLREIDAAGHDLTFGTPDDPLFNPGELSFDNRLVWTLLLALSDGDDLFGDTYYGSYNGAGSPEFEDTRRLAAAFAANIKSYRTPGDTSSLNRLEPVPGDLPANQNNAALGIAGFPGPSFDSDGNPLATGVPVIPFEADEHYLGMELQPFIVEAFIAHVYKAYQIPAESSQPFVAPYTDAGQFTVMDDDGPGQTTRGTIIVVQVANPFDRPIDLSRFRIQVFGQNYTPNLTTVLAEGPNNRLDLNGDGTMEPVLPPGTPERPSTAIFVAIRPTLTNTTVPAIDDIGTWLPLMSPTGSWLDFLDITPLDFDGDGDLLPDDTIIFNATTNGINGWRVVERDWYDGTAPGAPASAPAVAIVRRMSGVDLNGMPYNRDIIVDRIDDPELPVDESFRQRVEDLMTDVPDDAPMPLDSVAPDSVTSEYPFGYKIGTDTHWVQWARATRAWGADVDRSGMYEAGELNPRYISADRVVTSSRPTTAGPQDPANGDDYLFADDPDTLWPASINALYFPPSDIGSGLLATGPILRKPTFFDMNFDLQLKYELAPTVFPTVPNFPDKGWYGQVNGSTLWEPDQDPTPVGIRVRMDYALQMLQKDRNFDQVGELLNVWLYTHLIEGTFDAVTGQFGPGPLNISTSVTFSEYMSIENDDLTGGNGGAGTVEQVLRRERRINRLQIADPTSGIGEVIGEWDPNLETIPNDPDARFRYLQMFPDVPAGVRVLDAFVCDGPGLVEDYNNNGFVDVGLSGNIFGTADLDTHTQFERSYRNAVGYTGEGTNGLININTAPVEVMRALPHMDTLVHLDRNNDVISNGSGSPTGEPLIAVPQAILHYRERFEGRAAPLPRIQGYPNGANYLDRPTGVREERGIASIGELMLLTRINPSPSADRPTNPRRHEWFSRRAWDIEYAGDTIRPPYSQFAANQVLVNDPVLSQRLGVFTATDVNSNWQWQGVNPVTPAAPLSDLGGDRVAGDAEEANLLFAGISNLITTRSDTFVVHFKIRTFRQNPTTGVWDATDPEQIVDEKRFVMVVDRSRVNRPTDAPRILLLEKLPN